MHCVDLEVTCSGDDCETTTSNAIVWSVYLQLSWYLCCSKCVPILTSWCTFSSLFRSRFCFRSFGCESRRLWAQCRQIFQANSQSHCFHAQAKRMCSGVQNTALSFQFTFFCSGSPGLIWDGLDTVVQRGLCNYITSPQQDRVNAASRGWQMRIRLYI